MTDAYDLVNRITRLNCTITKRVQEIQDLNEEQFADEAELRTLASDLVPLLEKLGHGVRYDRDGKTFALMVDCKGQLEIVELSSPTALERLNKRPIVAEACTDTPVALTDEQIRQAAFAAALADVSLPFDSPKAHVYKPLPDGEFAMCDRNGFHLGKVQAR
jgi:hypothetical protein